MSDFHRSAGTGEPVAYRWRIKNSEGQTSAWALSETDPKIGVLHDCEPLFTNDAQAAPDLDRLREDITNAIIDNMTTLNGLRAAVDAIMVTISRPQLRTPGDSK